MSDFWKSYDITAAEYGAGYECYPLFGTVHLIELALSALFLLGMVWWYRRSTPRTRRHILVGVTAALLADEAALLPKMRPTARRNFHANLITCLIDRIHLPEILKFRITFQKRRIRKNLLIDQW